MKIGVLGTGLVGSTIGTKLVSLGHEVRMGSRTTTNEKATAWVATARAHGHASQGTFADAAAFGEILFNCTGGSVALAALEAAGPKNLSRKILIDLSNALDFSKGMPPTLSVCNTDSIGEQIQRAFPEVRVVKTLNTVNCALMIDPASLPGEHDLFVSGNDPAAKAQVVEILKGWFGWKTVIDLGDITTARGPEMFLALWVRLMGSLQTPTFNIHVVV